MSTCILSIVIYKHYDKKVYIWIDSYYYNTKIPPYAVEIGVLMNEKLSPSASSIDHLKEISTWVSSVLDLDALLELIINTATRMMQARASSLLLLDQKTKRLYFKVATGEKKEEIRKYELNLGQGIAGFVAEKGEPLLIPDVEKDRRWYKAISESIGFKTRSIACVPMKVNGKIIGVVEIIDKEDGSPIYPNAVSNAWQRLAKKAGLNGIRLHDARHTHASYMLKQGIHPKVVQERLGHSSIQVTLDTYSHVAPGIQEKAAAHLDDIFKTERRNEPVETVG